jgi:hypothetical protein
MNDRPDWLLAILAAGVVVASPVIGFGLGWASSRVRVEEREKQQEGNAR